MKIDGNYLQQRVRENFINMKNEAEKRLSPYSGLTVSTGRGHVVDKTPVVEQRGTVA